MRLQKGFLIVIIGLVSGFAALTPTVQPAQDDFSTGELQAGAKLVVVSVTGPVTAAHNQTAAVTYRVKNQGDLASGSYKVGLYLSSNNNIDPALDRLLDKVTFAKGLAPGESRATTTKVLVPTNGLAGKYFYGAAVAGSKKASSVQLSLGRYSLADNNATVTDHKTGLIWQRADDGAVRDWADAGQYCKDLVLDAKADWRLPSIDELESLVKYSRYSPAIDPLFKCRSDYYWSSSTVANGPDAAWEVSFSGGYVDAYGKGSKHYARCVRGRL